VNTVSIEKVSHVHTKTTYLLHYSSVVGNARRLTLVVIHVERWLRTAFLC